MDLELEQDPVKCRGDDDRDKVGVATLTEDTSDGGDEDEPPCTGVEVPEDSALPMLTSETDCSSADPSVVPTESV